MAGGKLPLLKRGPQRVETATPEPKREVPVFHPERLAAQAAWSGGSCFVQGKNMFSLKGAFISEAPEHLWYITTPEQEENNRRVQLRKKAATAPRTKEGAVPAKVIELARENARALAAEAYAE
jgi:hypothetical protein